MRALTLIQPWLELIVSHGKRTENRTYGTPYRGLLALHASARSDKPMIRAMQSEGWSFPALPIGAVVAVAELVDVHSADDSACRCDAWAETGPRIHHWVLDVVQALPDPIRCPGARRLWTPPTHVLQELT